MSPQVAVYKEDERQHKMRNERFNTLISLLSTALFCTTISMTFAAESVLQRMEQDFQAIVKLVRPSVVEIIATQTVHFPNRRSVPEGLQVDNRQPVYHYKNIGSGIIINTAGYIVTTGGVIDKANTIEVKFADGKLHQAKLRGFDAMTDIAVLEVERHRPFQTAIGNADQIGAGSWVVTIGSSYGQSPTFSFGIVSGLEILSSRPFYEAIKINTSVTPGNSGGAVVNTSGEIVGLIAATLAESYPSSHPELIQPSRARPSFPENGILMGREISFAIPIQTVQTIAEQLIEHGKVPRGRLGVWVESDIDGARVTEVFENSPAQKAGLLPQDVIFEFNGIPVHTFLELKKLVGTLAPKTAVTIKIRRDGKHLQRNVVLAEMK